MKRIIVIALSILFVTTALFAQRPQTQQREPREPVYKTNLDQLPEEERNEYLLQISRDMIMRIAPDWYRDCGRPKIERFIPEAETEIARHGKIAYKITRYYDESAEYFEWGFSSMVIVNEETGRVATARFGHGRGWGDLDKPGVLENIPRIQFDRERHRPRPDLERWRKEVDSINEAHRNRGRGR